MPDTQLHINDSNHVMIFHLDENFIIKNANNPALTILQLTEDKLFGKNFLDISYPEDRNTLKNKIKNTIRNENNFESWELRKQKKNGEIIWVREFIQTIPNKDGEKIIKVCSTNITKQKAIEKKLLENEKKYRNLINNSRNGIIVHSEDTLLFANPSAIKIIGAKKESDIVGKNIYKFIHPESKNDIKKRIENMYRTGKAVGQYEGKFVTSSNGETITLQTIATPIEHEGKRAIQVILKDVTKEKAVEKALQESKEKFHSIFEKSSVGIILIDNENNIKDINPKFSEWFGHSKEELCKMSILDLIQPDAIKSTKNLLAELRSGKRDKFYNEKKYIKKDGSLIWGSITVKRLTTSNYDDKCLIGIFDNITKRVNAVESLKTRDKILSALSFSTETFLKTLKWQANIEEVLKRLGEALDVSRCYIFQNHFDKNNDLLLSQRYKWIADKKYQTHPNVKIENISYKKSGLTNLLKTLQQKKVYLGNIKDFPKKERKNYEITNTKSLIIVPIFIFDKLWGLIGFDECRHERIWTETEIATLSTAGNTLGVAIKRKYFEEELLKAKLKAEESDKLKSQFLAQMSHEIRSPINTILSFTSLIENDIKGKITEELANSFNIIKSAGDRLIRTIDLILNMSEIQTGSYEYSPRKADIYSDILLNLINEAKASVKNKKIKFHVKKTTDDTIRIVDSYTVSQIFVNLLDNAFKYTKEGEIELKINLTKKGKLEISVSDTGIGIAPEYIPKLFNPFSQEEQGYTRSFEGNGLGLALVKNYCEMNNADIKVKSKKGVGTTFTVIFN